MSDAYAFPHDDDDGLEHYEPQNVPPAPPRIGPEVAADPIMVQWSRWREAFAEAMGDGFWTIEDLELKIAHKRAFFFPGKDCALVGEITAYPGGERAFQVLWAAGDAKEVVAMAPGVEAMARMMGCTSMLVESREAWKRLLGPQGYEPWSITLRKAL